MLQQYSSSLEQGYKDVGAKSAESRGIAARISLHAEYAGLVGKTALAAGSDAAGIYFRTLKNATVSLLKGA
jgi:hypothetical protein